jgi:hypothetical protein
MIKKKISAKTINRKMVIKALTDPKFRRLLKSDPTAALGKRKLTDIQQKEVNLVLAAVKGIDQQINSLADELLCANGGGGCSIG